MSSAHVRLGFLTAAAAMCLSAQNYLHTSGNQILDSSNRPVRITGINWFGMETSNYAPHGLWTRGMGSFLDQIASLGYNTIRVPYSNQLFDAGSTPNGIDFSQNADLQGLSGIQILDKLVAGAKSRGLKIILDRHRPDSGGQSELWYTGQYSETRWINDWKMLATRYLNDDTVIGCDLHNEPHGSATWGDGNQSTDWRLAAERAGNAILSVNPKLLIIVEGIEKVGNDFYWWGGNLSAAGANPVRLSAANQLVYSAHDYPASVYGQSWFNASNYPNNLAGVWDSHWGYLASTTPVLVGEFGTKYETNSDKQWLQTLANYLASKSLNFTYWCLNPNSGDTGGILQDDWRTVRTDKQAILQPLLAAKIGSSGGGTTPTPPATPSGVSAIPGNGQVIVSWSAVNGAGSYKVYYGTSSGITANSSSQTSNTNSFTFSGLTNGTTYYFRVTALSSANLESTQSTEVSAMPSGAPAAPANFNVTGGVGQVSLTWSAAPGATSYTLYRKTGNGNYSTLRSNLTGTSYQDSQVQNGTAYTYQLTASNSAGEGARTPEKTTTPSAATTVPGAPGTLTAAAGTGQVALSWSSVSGATGYTLYRQTGGTRITLLNAANQTSYLDTAVTAGTNYIYGVAASNSAGTSSYTTASATPTAPSGGSGGGVTATGKVAPGASGYYGELDVVVANTAPITALTIQVTVKKTPGITYGGQFNNFWGGMLSMTYAETSSAVVYTYTLNGGQSVPVGTNWMVASQFRGSGTAHPTSGDTYSVTATSGGVTKTYQGTF